MNKNIEQFKRKYKDKKVAVLGVGISNIPVIRFLISMDIDITAFDKNESMADELKRLSINSYYGKDYLKHLRNFDIIFRTPGIRPDLPEIVNEINKGAKLTSEMELFFDLCPAKIFAVTGSDGKTTTTTIIYNILKESGYKCWIGGNIGISLFDSIEEIREEDYVILELSSFQLLTMRKSPNISVITNVSPNHMDYHKSMEEYINAKKNIFLHQEYQDRVVLNYDNETTRNFDKEAKGSVSFFSRRTKIESGAYTMDGKIFYKSNGEEKEIIDVNEILLPGKHNVENYMAAICAVMDYTSKKEIKSVVSSFKGVEHRNEQVREINGIKFYNDSIGTSPSRTIATLNSFDKKVILIAGGYDKKLSYEMLGDIIVEKVKTLILIGQTSKKIKESLKKARGSEDVDVIKCKNLKEAVLKAFLCASEGDVVLLSPASASFDMFKNFEERGKIFKQTVKNLSEK